MYPYRNILFPTDFSTEAHAALKYAAAFARQHHGRIVLFSVQSGTVPANLLTLPSHVFDDPDMEWLKNLRNQVRELLADPLLEGLEVETVIIEGDPAHEIAVAARRFDIDLITVVTSGRRGLSRALWGSRAEEIIVEAPCPVLTIRPPQRDFAEHRGSHTEIRLNRILLATNFRQSAVGASHAAAELAREYGAELHAVYVVSDFVEQIGEMFPGSAGAGVSRLKEFVASKMEGLANEARTTVHTHILEGRPYEQIVHLASVNDVDLIVIGKSVHQSTFGGAPGLGPEIERVVRNAPCPVLCVPPQRG
jgi:nucleotide-binding universal stress UspA family protein